MNEIYQTTVDNLIEENADLLPPLPEDTNIYNLNYSLRFVLTYLVKYYDDIPDIASASDHLAKIIAQMEKF